MPKKIEYTEYTYLHLHPPVGKKNDFSRCGLKRLLFSPFATSSRRLRGSERSRRAPLASPQRCKSLSFLATSPFRRFAVSTAELGGTTLGLLGEYLERRMSYTGHLSLHVTKCISLIMCPMFPKKRLPLSGLLDSGPVWTGQIRSEPCHPIWCSSFMTHLQYVFRKTKNLRVQQELEEFTPLRSQHPSLRIQVFDSHENLTRILGRIPDHSIGCELFSHGFGLHLPGKLGEESPFLSQSCNCYHSI